ncbi:Slp family lipoprotein [Vibrio sp. CAU 1672]|uniref:Slp family lipoprotein n=1 Tax=Vibrio sp. CAU 1672 TaxID=3032594 RepID=UPI0023D984A3|nr:Slp family lipoprotein [Vibrio sp. CAU 1672]MDF2155285.1 Slp family lipoprotein [Vibrio sp. CAU 1672]
MKLSGRTLLALLAAIGLSACSSLPEELNASTEQVVTDYEAFARAQGQVREDVRLGGIIARVDNMKDQTRLEVVNLPINKSGKPNIDKEPSGRFAVYIKGYLEPVAFSQGRLITVVGQPGGEEAGMIGEHDYTFPVVNGTGYRLWKIEERVRMYDTPTYLSPCYSLNCRMMRSDFPQDGKVIKQVK